MKPTYAIGSVPSLSGHAIAYRWRSLPRVRRRRASKPQGSSERVLPWQITIDQLIFASLSHTHYWYEVGMLKVPAATHVIPCSVPGYSYFTMCSEKYEHNCLTSDWYNAAILASLFLFACLRRCFRLNFSNRNNNKNQR